MEEIEVPEYFICPISLQIMKDPVTAITGITYDRESIEHWLFKSMNTTCPVTKQPLPKDSDLTPNHTLRRLIQAWCTSHGVDRIPTPKPLLTKFHVLKLIKDLSNPHLQQKTLKKLELLAAENERNRKHMVEAGIVKAMVSFIVTCFNHSQIAGLEEALSILHLVRNIYTMAEINFENCPILESLTWVLRCKLDDYNHVPMKTHAVLVLRKIIETTSSSNVLEMMLKPEFFRNIACVLNDGISQQAINAALQIMLDACPWGRNRIMMVEAGAVFELIELILGSLEKRTTELIFEVLFHLCCCADGRAQLLSHGGGIAVVSKRILRISQLVNDRGILILSMISKYSGTSMVAHEMLHVGAFSKLFKVLQHDSPIYLKDKAKEILRSHMSVWKNSPCIDSSLLTTYMS